MFIEKFLIFKGPKTSKPTHGPSPSAEKPRRNWTKYNLFEYGSESYFSKSLLPHWDKAISYRGLGLLIKDEIDGQNVFNVFNEESPEADIFSRILAQLKNYVPEEGMLPDKLENLSLRHLMSYVADIAIQNDYVFDRRFLRNLNYEAYDMLLRAFCQNFGVIDFDTWSALKGPATINVTERIAPIIDSLEFDEPQQTHLNVLNRFDKQIRTYRKDQNIVDDDLAEALYASIQPPYNTLLKRLILQKGMPADILRRIFERMDFLQSSLDAQTIESSSNGVALSITDLYDYSCDNVTAGFRFIDLVLREDLLNSPVYSNGFIRSAWIAELVNKLYGDSPIGKVLNSIRISLQQNPRDAHNLKLWHEFLLKVRREFKMLERVQKSPLLVRPFIGLQEYLNEMSMMSTAAYNEAQIGGGLAAKVFSGSGFVTLPVSAMLASAVVINSTNEKSAMQFAAAMSQMSTEFIDALPKELQKALQLDTVQGKTDSQKEQFTLLPFIIRSMVLEPDLASKSLAQLKAYLNKSDKAFLSGDSILLQHLRDSSSENYEVMLTKALLRSVLKRIQSNTGNLLKDVDDSRLCLGDLMLGWLTTDEIFGSMGTLGLDTATMEKENPQAPQTIPEKLEEPQKEYVKLVKDSTLVSSKVLTAFGDDEKIFANYNYRLDEARHTIRNISSTTGYMFEEGSRVVDFVIINLTANDELPMDGVHNM